MEDRLQVLKALSQNPDWDRTLREALEVEERGKAQFEAWVQGLAEDLRPQYQAQGYLGWEWHEVHEMPPTLNVMVKARLLDVAYSSRSATHYRLRNSDLIREALERLTQPPVDKEAAFPQDLFSSIVGHDNLKEIANMALRAPRPAHILMQGPPASAKTLFLMELARLPNSYYCLAQTLTSAGLADILFLYQPDYLLIDEVDRLDGQNVGVLNSLMATGIISESKVGKTRSMELSTRVFAAGIRIDRLPRDLLSRFIKLRFDPYTQAQFREVCERVLPREGCAQDIAGLIADQVWGIWGVQADLRQAVQVARLGAGDMAQVQDVLRALKRYGFS